MDQEIDERYLRRALELAARGPEANPNPRVGCVIARDGEVLAEGWHQGAGTPHAEAMALAALAASTRSARSANQEEPAGSANQEEPARSANQEEPARSANQEEPARSANQETSADPDNDDEHQSWIPERGAQRRVEGLTGMDSHNEHQSWIPERGAQRRVEGLTGTDSHNEHQSWIPERGAQRRVEGLTAYVTLEPCAHTGRTGPCAQALLDAGVARVVYAQADPNPVAAGGATVLRSAGVDVVGGVLADEAEALNRTWTHLARTGRPFVTWKYAATLDGRSAAADGTSKWITSAEARADVGERRSRCGAVVVGTGTALVDDPHLTARRPDGTLLPTQPLRVVVGSRPIPAAARVLDDAAPTLLLATRSPAEVLAELAARGIHHVWLEGGPTLAAAWLRAGVVDEVLAYLAPALLGSGPAAVADLGVVTIPDALWLQLTDVARVGPDVRLTLAPSPTQPSQPTKED